MIIHYFFREKSDKNLVDYIAFVQDCLLKICKEKESGLLGLKYYGGPEVICSECKTRQVVPYVKYDHEKDSIQRDVKGSHTCYECNALLLVSISTARVHITQTNQRRGGGGHWPMCTCTLKKPDHLEAHMLFDIHFTIFVYCYFRNHIKHFSWLNLKNLSHKVIDIIIICTCDV